MENKQTGERLRCGFHSPGHGSLRSAVRYEDDVLWTEQGVRSLARQDFAQVDRSLLSFTTLLVCADNSRVALCSGGSESSAQSQGLKHGDFSIRFQDESAGFAYFTNH